MRGAMRWCACRMVSQAGASVSNTVLVDTRLFPLKRNDASAYSTNVLYGDKWETRGSADCRKYWQAKARRNADGSYYRAASGISPILTLTAGSSLLSSLSPFRKSV